MSRCLKSPVAISYDYRELIPMLLSVSSLLSIGCNQRDWNSWIAANATSRNTYIFRHAFRVLVHTLYYLIKRNRGVMTPGSAVLEIPLHSPGAACWMDTWYRCPRPQRKEYLLWLFCIPVFSTIETPLWRRNRVHKVAATSSIVRWRLRGIVPGAGTPQTPP